MMMPRELELAFAVALGDGAAAAEEVTRSVLPRKLDKCFSKRALTATIRRASAVKFEVANTSLELMQRILWRRTVSLAR